MFGTIDEQKSFLRQLYCWHCGQAISVKQVN